MRWWVIGGGGGGGGGGLSTLTAGQLQPQDYSLTCVCVCVCVNSDATLNTEIHTNLVRIKAPNSVNATKQKHKYQSNHFDKQRQILMALIF